MFSSVCPEEYHLKFFSQDIRSDGRAFSEKRPNLVISKVSKSGSNYDSFLVKKGNSILFINIFAHVTIPQVPDNGYFGIKVISRSSNNEEENWYSHSLSSTLSRYLHLALFPMIQKSQLIISDKAVWAIYLEIIVFIDDGAIFDLLVDAAMTVLKDFFLPKVQLEELDTGTIIIRKSGLFNSFPLLPTLKTLNSKSISIVHINEPIDRYIQLIDPSAGEENLPNTAQVSVLQILEAESKDIKLFRKLKGPALPWNILTSILE